MNYVMPTAKFFFVTRLYNLAQPEEIIQAVKFFLREIGKVNYMRFFQLVLRAMSQFVFDCISSISDLICLLKDHFLEGDDPEKKQKERKDNHTQKRRVRIGRFSKPENRRLTLAIAIAGVIVTLIGVLITLLALLNEFEVISNSNKKAVKRLFSQHERDMYNGVIVPRRGKYLSKSNKIYYSDKGREVFVFSINDELEEKWLTDRRCKEIVRKLNELKKYRITRFALARSQFPKQFVLIPITMDRMPYMNEFLLTLPPKDEKDLEKFVSDLEKRFMRLNRPTNTIFLEDWK